MCKKGHYVLLQDLVVFECFTKFYVSLLKIRQNSKAQTVSNRHGLHPNCTKDTNTTTCTSWSDLYLHIFGIWHIKDYRKFPIQPLFTSNLLLYICKYSTKAIIQFEGMLNTQNWNFFNNVINTKRELTLRDNVVNYGFRKAGYLMSVKKQWWFDFKTSKSIFSWHSFSNTPSRIWLVSVKMWIFKWLQYMSLD